MLGTISNSTIRAASSRSGAARVPLGGWSAALRDELCFAFAVKFARVLALGVLAIQRALQPVLDADAARSLHGRDARVRRGRDLRVVPASLRAIGVRQQEDARVPL